MNLINSFDLFHRPNFRVFLFFHFFFNLDGQASGLLMHGNRMNWQRSLAKWVVFFSLPKVIPYRNGKASTETAKEIVLITLNARKVPFPIAGTSTVHLHAMWTTMTDPWLSNAREMESPLELQASSVSQLWIGGKIINFFCFSLSLSLSTTTTTTTNLYLQ